MEKQWYILKTKTGNELSAKEALLERIESKNMQDYFGEMIIPSENVVQMIRGRKQTRNKKFFPGYIFISMHLNDHTWHLVRSVTKISGFIGNGTVPSPISEEEVKKIAEQVKEGSDKVKPKINFNLGETVVVRDGPFSNFNGTVEEINEEKCKVKVLVSIFGRPTPVELDFTQVEKA